MKQPTDIAIQPRILQILLVVTALVALPHALHMPLPITLFFMLMILWRLGLFYYPRFTPHRLLLMALTLSGLTLVYIQHQTLLGRGAGVSLLTIMLALKTMELRRQRDIYVVVFISFFVVVSQFLFNQTLLLALYLLALVLLMLALLLEINQSLPSRRLADPVKRTLVITLQSLPVALILFVLFPRLSQPIWQLDGTGASAMSGLSERVAPGAISQLIQSQTVAFRVHFSSPAPAPELRYWRGLVLWETDGFEWFNGDRSATDGEPSRMFKTQGKPVEYELTLEPHYKDWLFALDLPATAPIGTSMTRDYLLRTRHPVRQLVHYPLISFTQYKTDQVEEADLERALVIPDNITQRERALVEAWKSDHASPREIINKALAHFNKEEFVYTLKPPLYRDNPVDQFLFEAREGFCEHYASSFILLMRLAGIPARMVIGYQGGEYNPVGDYYILRQSDAHAWSEVWLQGEGWTRIDPTAAVAPERIRHSILTDAATAGSPVLFRLDDEGLLGSALRGLGLALDAANIGWRRWILDYNHERQFRLLQYLGMNLSRIEEWFGLIISLVAFSLLLIGLRIGLQGRKKEDPVLRAYKRLCSKLAAAGMSRELSEGPKDYSLRVVDQFPQREAEINELFRCYIELRYGRSPNSRLQTEFRDRVRRFRL